MNIKTDATLAYQHPDGFTLAFNENMLTAAEDDNIVRVPICSLGLIALGEPMTMVNTQPAPKTGNPYPLVRQQVIENALSMALFHVRHGDIQSIQVATGRAMTAASLLKQARAEAKKDGAA